MNANLTYVETSSKYKVISKVFDHLFVIILCILFFLNIYGSLNLNSLLLIVFLVYLIKNIFLENFHSNIPRYTWIDSAIVLLAVAEGVSYISSTYRENSFYNVIDLSFFILFFYWIKFNLKDYQRTATYIFLAGFGVLISINGTRFFLSLYFQMKSIGLNDLSDFRHIFYFGSPMGSPTGEWITLFLAFLPFPLILLFAKFKIDNCKSLFLLIPVILILAIPVMSCSRGMYLALASFAFFGSTLLLLYKLYSLKKVFRFNLLFLLSIGLIIVVTPLFKPVLTTISMFQTTSQVRSFEGRKSLWKTGIEIIKDHPVTGIGSNNYAIKHVTYKDKNEDSQFVSRVFNIFLQITIEKGFIGLLAYCFIIIAFFFISHQKLKLLHNNRSQQVVIILFMSAFAAILVRDLTYSSMLSNKGVHLLFWFMFAHNAQLPDQTIPLQINSRKKIIWLIPIIIGLLIFTVIAIHSTRKEKANDSLVSFVDTLKQGNSVNAQRSIEAAIQLSPNNAYYWACRGLLAERTLNQKFILEKYLANESILNDSEKEQIGTAIASYRKALELNPEDDGFYHNLGWLYFLNKDEKQAEYCFRQAIQIENTVAIHHVSLGILKEKERDKDSALEEYGEAVRQSPSLLDSPFFIELGKRLPIASKQIVSNCIQFLENESQQNHNPTTTAKLAKLYLFEGEKQKAQLLLEQVTKELPSLSRPWLYLGDLYQSNNKDSETVQCYQKSAFLDRMDISPLLRLGHFYDQKNDTSKAIQYYRKLISVLPFQYSIHASRVSRMYRTAYKGESCVVKDDLIPNGFLMYCIPFFDISSVYQRLADLYTKKGDTKKAEEYLRLSKKLMP